MSEQVSRLEVGSMTPEQMRDALKDGRLDSLLVGKDPGRLPPVGEYVGSADQGPRGPERSRTERERLRTMSPAEIRDALHRGELDPLLRGDVV